jgi:hypothetical protein
MPEGQHTIRFVYEDDVFKMGAVISGISLLACLIGWFRLKKTSVAVV